MSYKIPLEDQLSEDRMIKLYKDHAGLSISHDVNDFENVDCTIYNESSADGYDLWVVTNNPKSPSICEEVFYYDSDIADQFAEQVRWGDRTFYVCDGVYDDCYFHDKLLELFAENVEDIVQEAEDGVSDTDITLKEIKLLKEEYGLTEETEEADGTEVV